MLSASDSLFAFMIQISALERYWHLFYFILLPQNANVTGWTRLMETVSLVIPTHSNVYWMAPNGFQGSSNHDYLMWETYSVKDRVFVHPVPTANITDLSFLEKLVEDRWLRRQDFWGSVITATAVVLPVNYDFRHPLNCC